MCGIKRRLLGWASESIVASDFTGEENLPLTMWCLRAKKKWKGIFLLELYVLFRSVLGMRLLGCGIFYLIFL